MGIHKLTGCTTCSGPHGYISKTERAIVRSGQCGIRRVAIKKVTGSLREFDLMAIRNRNIIQFYHHNGIIQVMDFADGGTLADNINNIGAYREDIAMQVCSGLVYLHSMDFLHKNIRTSNILLTRNFDAKIAGFGSDDIYVDPSRMAPELRSDPSKHSAESDIYALGVVMELMGEGSKDYMRWMAMCLDDNPKHRPLTCPIMVQEQKAITPPEELKGPLESLKKIESLGNARVAFALGIWYHIGFRVTKDEVKAQEYFMKAANLGDREAQYNVGVYYLHQKDYVVAENWFRKAAKQGFLEAWSALGDLLHERHRYADALENYKYAASAGDAHSQYWLGEMYYRGDTLQENSFTFKESYQRHTIEDDTWFEKFSRGRSIQDDTLAYKWFLEAANQGHADAAYSVGYMHQYGRGANQSYEEAEKWYLAAIDKGNVPAQRSLQRMRCNRAIELAMMSVAEEELSYDEITLVLRNQSTHSLNPVDWARASMEWHSNIADKLRLLEQRRD